MNMLETHWLVKVLTLMLIHLPFIYVQGCASLNKSECQNANWETIGYEDGAKGIAASRIGAHREACAKHGISPNLDAYRQGREEGLREYCRPPNGFRLGERGASYAGICPHDLEQEFLAAYASGKRIHSIKSDIVSTEKHIKLKKQELAELENKRQSMQSEMIGDGVSTGRRSELFLEVIELSKDHDEIENEITILETELQQKRDTLAYTRSVSHY